MCASMHVCMCACVCVCVWGGGLHLEGKKKLVSWMMRRTGHRLLVGHSKCQLYSYSMACWCLRSFNLIVPPQASQCAKSASWCLLVSKICLMMPPSDLNLTPNASHTLNCASWCWIFHTSSNVPVLAADDLLRRRQGITWSFQKFCLSRTGIVLVTIAQNRQKSRCLRDWFKMNLPL